MIINVYRLVGQLGDHPAAGGQPPGGQQAGQLRSLGALADDDGLPIERGLQQGHQVQRFFVGIQPPYKDEDLRVNVQFQGAAQVGPGAGHVGDDGSVQPHGHQPGAGHAQALQLGGDGGRFGEGRCFFVNGQVAAQQQVHHSADGSVAGGAFQRTQLAVKQDAVFAAEAVERRHAGGVIAHDVDRIDLLVQQHLPAGKERLRA